MNHNHPITSTAFSIEEELLAKKSRNDLLKLISQLGVLDRDILVMKFILANSNEEIASNMGLGQQTIEHRISRALKKLALT